MGKKKGINLWERFRFSIIKEKTHEIVLTFKMSRFAAIVGILTAVIVIALGTYCAVAFTPLKTSIPGYPDAHSRRLAIENAIKIDSLESMLTRWELYSNNLLRVFNGEQTLEKDSLLRGNRTRYLKNRSEEFERKDSLLRSAVASEERFGISGKKRDDMPIDGLHFFTPVKGVVSKKFDALTGDGMEVKTAEGNVVCAVLDGTVVYSSLSGINGYTVVIQHPNNILSVYGHVHQSLKRQGETVSAGSVIAISGPDYVQLELWDNGTPTDPEKYIIF